MALHRAPTITRRQEKLAEDRYHIDFGWWENSDRDLRVYMLSHLCPEHQEMFSDFSGDDMVDWIDPKTAEVKSVDGLQHTLRTHCRNQPDYITSSTSLINAIFRLFLANGNSPLTTAEIGKQLHRPASMIRKTLSGQRVFKGIRQIELSDVE